MPNGEDTLVLQETDRAKLDGIVQQMVANKESDDNIQFVVSDFKTKYGKKKEQSATTTAPLQNGGQPVSNNTPTTSTAETTPLDLLTGRWKQNFQQQNLQSQQPTVTPQQNQYQIQGTSIQEGSTGNSVNVSSDININTRNEGGIKLKLLEQGLQDVVPQAPKDQSQAGWTNIEGDETAPIVTTQETPDALNKVSQLGIKPFQPQEPSLTPPKQKTELEIGVQEERNKYVDVLTDEILSKKDIYLDKNILTKDGLVSIDAMKDWKGTYSDKDLVYTQSDLLNEHIDDYLNNNPDTKYLNGADKFAIKKGIEKKVSEYKFGQDAIKLTGAEYQGQTGKIAPDFAQIIAPKQIEELQNQAKVDADEVFKTATSVTAKNLYNQYASSKITKQQYSEGIDNLNNDMKAKLDAIYKGYESSAQKMLSQYGLSEQDLTDYSKVYGKVAVDMLVAKNKQNYNTWKNYDAITKLSKGIDLGVYQMVESMGGSMAQQGMYDLADKITRTTGVITENMQVPNMGDFSWESLADPVWWATHAVPSATSSAIFLIPSLAIGASTGGLGIIGQGITAGVTNRALESYTESGDTYNQAIKNGLSPEEAGKAAAKVWKDNMYLTGLDALQMTLLFTPMGSKLASFGKGMFEGVTNYGEEVYQGYSSVKALGQFEGNIIDYAKSPEGIESGFLGALIGVTTSGISDIGATTDGKEYQAQAQKMYNMLMQDGGNNIDRRAGYIRTMINDLVANGTMTAKESATASDALSFIQGNIDKGGGKLTKKQAENLGLKYYQSTLQEQQKEAKTENEKTKIKEKLEVVDEKIKAFELDETNKSAEIELEPKITAPKKEEKQPTPEEEKELKNINLGLDNYTQHGLVASLDDKEGSVGGQSIVGVGNNTKIQLTTEEQQELNKQFKAYNKNLTTTQEFNEWRKDFSDRVLNRRKNEIEQSLSPKKEQKPTEAPLTERQTTILKEMEGLFTSEEIEAKKQDFINENKPTTDATTTTKTEADTQTEVKPTLTEAQQQIKDLNDDETYTAYVSDINEVPESLRDRVVKVGGDIKTRKSFLGIPYGKETTHNSYRYSFTGKEAKDAILPKEDAIVGNQPPVSENGTAPIAPEQKVEAPIPDVPLVDKNNADKEEPYAEKFKRLMNLNKGTNDKRLELIGNEKNMTDSEIKQRQSEIDKEHEEFVSGMNELSSRKNAPKQKSVVPLVEKNNEALKKQVDDSKDIDEFTRNIITDYDTRYKNRKAAEPLVVTEKISKVDEIKPSQSLDKETIYHWEQQINEGKKPFVIIRNNNTIDGQHKLQAYKNLGYNEIPVLHESDLKKFYNENKKSAVPLEGEKNVGGEKKDYRGQHKIIKDETSSTLDDLTKGSAPPDIYTGMKYYADLKLKSYQESAKVINQVKGKPDAIVTIYRSVPKGVDKINSGDWVSLSKTYAKEHGMHHEDKKLDMPVISMKVKASDVVWDANDLNEFSYEPKSEQPIKEEKNIPEKKVENKGKEIEPHKEVSKSVTKAIDDVLKNGVGTGGIKPMEAQMLYTAFKDLDLKEYHIDNENGSTLNVGDKGLKGQIFKKLEEKGFVSDLGYYGDAYVITDSGKEFIDKIQSRVETRRGVKEGWDLFPEEANIPELKAKVKELKTVTDGKTIKKFGDKTESEIEELKPVVKNLESKEASATKTEQLEEVVKDANELIFSKLITDIHDDLVNLFGLNRFQAESLLAYRGNLDKILSAKKEDLLKIPSIGEKTADKIIAAKKDFEVQKSRLEGGVTKERLVKKSETVTPKNETVTPPEAPKEIVEPPKKDIVQEKKDLQAKLDKVNATLKKHYDENNTEPKLTDIELKVKEKAKAQIETKIDNLEDSVVKRAAAKAKRLIDKWDNELDNTFGNTNTLPPFTKEFARRMFQNAKKSIDDFVELNKTIEETIAHIKTVIDNAIEKLKSLTVFKELTAEEQKEAIKFFEDKRDEITSELAKPSDVVEEVPLAEEVVEKTPIEKLDDIKIKQSSEVEKYISGETIEDVFGDAPEGDQSYFVTKVADMLADGENIIETGKSVFGADVISYGTGLLNYFKGLKSQSETIKKSVGLASLIGNLQEQKLKFPERSAEINNLLQAVEREWQTFIHNPAVALNAGRILRLWRDKNIGSELANKLLDKNTAKRKKKINEVENIKKITDDVAEKGVVRKREPVKKTEKPTAKKQAKKTVKKNEVYRQKADAILKENGGKNPMLDKIKDMIKKIDC